MINPDSYQRFLNLRREVMGLIGRAMAEDPYGKSYEGAFELIIDYPNFYEDEHGTKEADAYGIRLHCYVLGSGRHPEWWGLTFEEALLKAEAEIHSWKEDDEEDSTDG